MHVTQTGSLGQEDSLEEEMATHSSIQNRQEESLEEEMATHSSIQNPMDRGVWWATVHGVTKSRTRLSDQAHPLIAAKNSVRRT